jgi:hypothetical protein
MYQTIRLKTKAVCDNFKGEGLQSPPNPQNKRPPLIGCPPLFIQHLFPAFYGTRWFITVFTTARHWSLSWARWIQSTVSHDMYLTSILILSGQPHVVSYLVSSGYLCDNYQFFYVQLSPPLTKPQAGGPPLIDCRQLLIQHVRSYKSGSFTLSAIWWQEAA